MAAFVWVGWGRRALLLLFLAILALVLGLARAAPTPQDVDREIRARHYDHRNDRNPGRVPPYTLLTVLKVTRSNVYG